MNKKDELLKECARIMESPGVIAWYQQNLKSQPQSETIKALEKGVSSGKLSLKAALSIALIVGVQWDVKFKGVP